MSEALKLAPPWPQPATHDSQLASAVLLSTPSLDAYEQMALDELLLDAAEPAFVLRFYNWKGPAVTFGYFQNYEEVISKSLGFRGQGIGSQGLGVRAQGLEIRDLTEPSTLTPHPSPLVVRRPTGGGVVFHQRDLTISFVFPRESSLAPQAVYKDIHRSIHLGFKSLGISLRLWSPHPSPL
ncbi:MAG: hypothetical protein HY399_00720, partial [Elusimicrobia bacterium]|nr:hypothetical protein [Elusimicrobiota bacterium]